MTALSHDAPGRRRLRLGVDRLSVDPPRRPADAQQAHPSRPGARSRTSSKDLQRDGRLAPARRDAEDRYRHPAVGGRMVGGRMVGTERGGRVPRIDEPCPDYDERPPARRPPLRAAIVGILPKRRTIAG